MLRMQIQRDNTLNNQLLEAVRKSDSKRVLALLHQGANPDAKDDFGRSALHIASTVTMHYPPSAEHPTTLLLDDGADIKTRDRLQNTPLHIAVECNNIKSFDSLLSQGVELNAVNNHGDTALSIAEMKKNWPLFKRLVGRGADLNIARDGNTLLHRIFDPEKNFTHEERELILETVLQPKLPRKANLNALNSQGYSPLHLAMLLGEYAYVSRLVYAGATINIASEPPNIGSRFYHLTPLSYLVMNANDVKVDPSNKLYQDLVTFLCQQGATVPPDNILQKSPEPIRQLFFQHSNTTLSTIRIVRAISPDNHASGSSNADLNDSESSSLNLHSSATFKLDMDYK